MSGRSKELSIYDSNAIVHPEPIRDDENPTLVYLGTLKSEHSKRAMLDALCTVCELLQQGKPEKTALAHKVAWVKVKPLWDLRYQHIQAIRAKLIEQNRSAAVINRCLSAIRGILKQAWKLGYMTANEYQTAIDVENYKVEKTSQAAGRSLSLTEVKLLIEGCLADNSPIGIRDAAMIALLARAGLRRSEIARLTMQDYNRNEGKLLVLGKGNKYRTVYLENRQRELFETWLDVRGNEPDKIFLPVRKGGKIDFEGKMTAQTVYDVLTKRGNEAGLAEFSPHDFRRTFIGDALDAGIDLATVAEIVGHSSTDTTRGYDRRGERAKRNAASKLDL